MGRAFEHLNLKRSDMFLLDPNDVVIVDDPTSDYYDTRAGLPVDDGLVASMLYKCQGNIQPCVIIRDGDMPVVIAGKQRVKAMRRANQILDEKGEPPMLLKCVYQRCDTKTSTMITAIENCHRRQNTPEETAALVETMQNRGLSRQEIALALGKSVNTIRNAEKFIELSEDVKQAVRDDVLSASTAVSELYYKSNAEQKAAIQERKENPPKRRNNRMRTSREIKDAIKLELYPPHVNEVLKWVLRENDDVVISPVTEVSKSVLEEDIACLKEAISDLLDGNCTAEWIGEHTGLDPDRCKELETLGKYCIGDDND